MGTPPILRSKLLPSSAGGLLPREAHRQLGRAILNHRLTCVTAGPGYGKSALISQALAGVEANSLWYRLDESDGDLTCFLQYLCAGLRAQLADFDFFWPDNLAEQLTVEQTASTLLKEFLVALEPVGATGLIIVLDDFHTVQQSGPLVQTFDFLLSYAPPEVHFVICSRETLQLPLSRLRAAQQLFELNRSELIFSAAEIKELFAAKFALSLDADRLQAIARQYQGWIAGLILLGQSLKRLDADQLQDRLAEGELPEPIREFFAELIFQPLAEQERDFLLRTALLDELEADICAELTDCSDSALKLQELADRGLFCELQPVAGHYRYHPLFRLFLYHRLIVTQGVDRAHHQHRVAAAFYEQRSAVAAALRQYLAAEESADVCRLLDQQGQRLFQQGRFELLRDCFKLLTAEQLAGYPRVEVLRGRLLGYFGDPAAAAQAYRRAFKAFAARGEQAESQQCLMEIAISNYHVGDMGQAAQQLDELLAIDDISADLRLEATGYQIFLGAYLNDLPQWRGLNQRAAVALDALTAEPLDVQQKAWLDVYRGYALNAAGERLRALEIGRSVAWRLQELEGTQEIHICYALIANVCFYLQHYEEGLAWAEKGLALLQKEGAKGARQAARPLPSGSRERGTQDTVLPLLLHHAANNAFGLGKTAEAIAYARQSAGLFRDMGVKWGESWALNMLSTAYAQQGDLVLAEQSGLAAVECSRGLNLPRIEGSAKGNLSVYLIARGRRAEALPLLEAVETAFTAKHLARWVDLWYANYYWRQNREKGRRCLQRALTLFDKQQDYGILAERHWIVPLLADSYARGQFCNYIMQVLRRIGSDALPQLKELLIESASSELKSAIANLLRELPKPEPPGLHIYLLGPFRISVGDRKIAAGDWRNRKARTLLQYMAYELPKGYIPREVLTELLWPEDDPQKTKNRFHVAMTALRKVLEPDLPDGVPSSYISRSGDAYRLQLGEDGFVDLLLFNELLSRAKQETDPALSSKLRNEALYDYSGELLAEDPYCDWCIDAREQQRRDYLATLEKQLEYYEQLDDYSRCVDLAERYLDSEPTAESIYRKLMIYHARSGNRSMISTCLKRCREQLQLHLDCPPETKTEQLARHLLTEATENGC